MTSLASSQTGGHRNEWVSANINPDSLWHNYSGSSNFAGPARRSSWIQCFDLNGRSPRCSFLGCGNDAVSGLHIENARQRGKIFVVPGCARCNSTAFDQDSVNLKRTGVRAIEQTTRYEKVQRVNNSSSGIFDRLVEGFEPLKNTSRPWHERVGLEGAINDYCDSVNNNNNNHGGQLFTIVYNDGGRGGQLCDAIFYNNNGWEQQLQAYLKGGGGSRGDPNAAKINHLGRKLRPLLCQCMSGNITDNEMRLRAVKLLIHYGADVNSYSATSSNMGTPLICAASNPGCAKVIETLIAAGANPSMQDMNGRKAIDFARQKNLYGNIAALQNQSNSASFKLPL